MLVALAMAALFVLTMWNAEEAYPVADMVWPWRPFGAEWVIVGRNVSNRVLRLTLGPRPNPRGPARKLESCGGGVDPEIGPDKGTRAGARLLWSGAA
jgi:hypothetical protein